MRSFLTLFLVRSATDEAVAIAPTESVSTAKSASKILLFIKKYLVVVMGGSAIDSYDLG